MKLIYIALALILFCSPAMAINQTINNQMTISGSKEKPVTLNPYTYLQKSPSPTTKASVYYDVALSDLEGKLRNYRILYGIGQIGFGICYYIRYY